ncbi:hypothetical protein J4E93_009968 [Alternaria ventricosa]|uniref:uncharacterized protein n=1 Tax=Alternaria ventricosa TaxID=1187951 RepID=UPI0020C565DB|nr:uncharacterized protein J4E93_009968 [Alternaria ventricosa]KAI4638667.1 hypothetical protein J4E93_009968 [Alternaria ventricosa]
MGVMTCTSSTIFNYPPEIIYDFVSNPSNWGRTYAGSSGLPPGQNLSLPLKVGDVWTEKVALPNNTYHPQWVLEIADRGRKFAFRQVNNIAAGEDGSGGVKGYCWITYTVEGLSANAMAPEKDEEGNLVYKQLEVKAGTLILMHGNLMHTSEANESGKGRVAFNFGVVEGTHEWLAVNYLQPYEFETEFEQLHAC